MMFPTQRSRPADDDDLEISFEPDLVTKFVAESLNEAGFSPENAWLLATRHNEIYWHKAAAMLAGNWSELDILKALV